MNDERHSDRHGAGSAARRVRTLARLVLLCGVLVAVLAPIAWERLPDFKAVKVSDPGDDPELPPDPGIDPAAGPAVGTLVRPSGPIPPHGSGAYQYFSTFGDRPPYVSTCEPVPFVIRTAVAPVDGTDFVFGGLQQVADATGLTFEFRGYTDDIYQFNQRRLRFVWENDRKPLWIGWATEDEVPDLGPKEGTYSIGLGGPVTYPRDDGSHEIIGGGVVLRSGESLPIAFGPGETAGNVLLHEFGHSLGLDHVDDRTELMYGGGLGSDAPNGFADGDRAGLEGIEDSCGSQ